LLRKYLTIDQTVHWADPFHEMGSVVPYAGPAPWSSIAWISSFIAV